MPVTAWKGNTHDHITLPSEPALQYCYGAYVNTMAAAYTSPYCEDLTYVEGFRIMPRNGLEKVYDVYYSVLCLEWGQKLGMK